jgi:hypothetical protein
VALRRATVRGAALAAVLVAAWSVAARAATAPTSNGGSRITGVPSGLCLDVTNGSTVWGTAVQLWNCLGDPQQAWVYTGGQLEVYGDPALCLDANGNDLGANGTPIDVWGCNGAANQKWIAYPDGTLRSAANGRCLDAIDGGKSNGTRLQLWDCIGDAQQDWVGPPIPNGGGLVIDGSSHMCLDVTGASISPGAALQLYSCLGDAQQQWQLVGRQLQVYADKCLDATADPSNGTRVVIEYCDGSPEQQWSWGSDGTIRSLPTGLCLDAVNDGQTDGTQVQLWKCLGETWQSWSRSVTTAPAPAPTPTAPITQPVSTTPVSTPLPRPTIRNTLAVRLVLRWTWSYGTTWLHRARIGSLPDRTRLLIRCRGRGCPRRRTDAAVGARRVRRLLRALAGDRYRSGDVLDITLSATGYLPERAEVIIRRARKPLVRLRSG